MKIALKTNGFSLFFKLLVVCFKWLLVASNWPQVGLRVNFGGKLKLPKPENSFRNYLFFYIF